MRRAGRPSVRGVTTGRWWSGPAVRVGCPGTEVAMRGFGDLEAVVMQAMWRREDPATVRQVFEELAAGRRIAYTTVMTVMDNLYRKGFLDRQMTGRAWSYQPTASREQ